MLPLRYTSDTTVFILWYNPNSPTNKKMLIHYILYKKHTVFSINGMRIYDEAEHSQYQIWKYQNSSERIDSLHIQNKEANTNEIENLQIFYRYRDRTPPTIE